MPALHELLSMVYRHVEEAGHELPDTLRTQLEKAIRATWPGERFYVAPVDSPKDPARAAAIKKACKSLPTKVVAHRFGVTPQRVYQIEKSKASVRKT